MTSQHEGGEAREVVRVEDDRTGMHPVALERAVLDHLNYTCGKDLPESTLLDTYRAVAHAVRDRLMQRWIQTKRTYFDADVKRAYYLSAEFLLGRSLGMNLVNLGLYEASRKLLKKYGIELADLLEEEKDPGLGNGGLGRLAACFLDSMATLGLPGYGYGIRYEFGIFEQQIRDGWQIERPDAWLRLGNPWEVPRHEFTVTVRFYGRVIQRVDEDGTLRTDWAYTQKLLGVPYDTPIAGYGNDTVNTLRLWRAQASQEFDLAVFNDGDYRRAVEEKALSESISKVLYPKDDTREGRELRLKQQYFFVACSIADILRRFKKAHDDLHLLPEKAAIQLNDTHPSIAVAELMRVLLDEEGLGWDEAWSITQRTISYTNHTLLSEALERWPLPLFAELLPRHLQIIYEINHRFLKEVHIFAPGDDARKRRMSIIQEGPTKQIRMAHLAVVGSHAVNGVAALHSELIRKELLPDFYEMWPERFQNKTNGVTPRRWLLLSNPGLARVLTERIGRGWIRDLDELEKLAPMADDPTLWAELREVKRENKRLLAQIVRARHGIELDLDSIFDVQVKRLHEYKRQLLNALHIVALYRRMRAEPDAPFTPRTFLFGGKAAPGYANAKLHIKFIHNVADIIHADPVVNGRIKVVFLANYGVSLAERIMPAADVSEQISMAGKEASGTGNMKFAMNGALTVGTLDGANIEIREAVGPENFFLFGLDAAGAKALKAGGYNPSDYIARSPALCDVVDLIESDFFSPDEPGLFQPIVDSLRHDDPYLVCADFDDYVATQRRVSETYRDPDTWSRMVVENIAHMGRFSSDRTIREYARDIWGVEPITVELEPPPEDLAVEV